MKPKDQRTQLTPASAASLLDTSFSVTVEDSFDRIFPIDDYS